MGIGESGEAESKEAAATDLALYKWQSGRNHSPVAFSATMEDPTLPPFLRIQEPPRISAGSSLDQARLAIFEAPPGGIHPDKISQKQWARSVG